MYICHRSANPIILNINTISMSTKTNIMFVIVYPRLLKVNYVCDKDNLRALEFSSVGYSLQGGCSGSGVQWMGVVSYSKTAYNIM